MGGYSTEVVHSWATLATVEDGEDNHRLLHAIQPQCVWTVPTNFLRSPWHLEGAWVEVVVINSDSYFSKDEVGFDFSAGELSMPFRQTWTAVNMTSLTVQREVITLKVFHIVIKTVKPYKGRRCPSLNSGQCLPNLPYSANLLTYLWLAPCCDLALTCAYKTSPLGCVWCSTANCASMYLGWLWCFLHWGGRGGEGRGWGGVGGRGIHWKHVIVRSHVRILCGLRGLCT